MKMYFIIILVLQSLMFVTAQAKPVYSSGSFKVANADVTFVRFAVNSVRVSLVGPEPKMGDRDNFLSDKASRPKLLAMLNGGYLKSFAPPTPLGLVRINGINFSKPIKTWVGEGLLCIGNNQVTISVFNEADITKNRDCLQSGPLLVNEGKNRYTSEIPLENGERKLLNSRQEHSFVCKDKSNNIILGYSEKITLRELVPALMSNLNCDAAIRMSGADTAGLVVGTRMYGNTDLQLHNAIGIFLR